MDSEPNGPKKRGGHKNEIIRILERVGIHDPPHHIAVAKLRAFGYTDPDAYIRDVGLGWPGKKWSEYEHSEQLKIAELFGDYLAQNESGYNLASHMNIYTNLSYQGIERLLAATTQTSPDPIFKQQFYQLGEPQKQKRSRSRQGE